MLSGLSRATSAIASGGGGPHGVHVLLGCAARTAADRRLRGRLVHRSPSGVEADRFDARGADVQADDAHCALIGALIGAPPIGRWTIPGWRSG